MQQDGTIAFDPVVQTSTLKTWHIIVAVFLFACVIYGVVWWAVSFRLACVSQKQ